MKAVLNWSAVSIGVILGTLALAILAVTSPARFSDEWPGLLSIGLYGCVCLFGSLIGLRNRRRAAAVFLWAVPAWIIVLLWLVYRMLVLTDGFDSLPQVSLILSIPTILGLFWFFTHRAGWSTVIVDNQPRTARRRMAHVLRSAFLLFVAVSLVAFGLGSIATSIGDCNEHPPFVKMRFPGHIAFVAKALTTGSAGEFPTLGLVEERFWGLPWWESHIVFISGYDFRRGETYFVEGQQDSDGLLTQFFPIVGTSRCGQTSLARESIELRVLRDGAPEGSVRVIGIVRNVKSFDPVPNAQILIKGPAGTIIKTTDAEGIYDVTGLFPGLYNVEITSPNAAGPRCRTTEVRSGEAWGCTLFESAPQTENTNE